MKSTVGGLSHCVMKSDCVGVIDTSPTVSDGPPSPKGSVYETFAESKDFIALATSSDLVGFIPSMTDFTAKLYSVRLRIAALVYW